MFLSIESRVHRSPSRNQNWDSNSEHSDIEWSLRSFSVILSLVKNLSNNVLVSGLYQQMSKIRSSQRISRDLSGLWESRTSCMSRIEERYSNNVCTSARFTFWSYFSSDAYEDLSTDFIQTKHEVRIDSLTARDIKQKTFQDKTERQNYRPITCSCPLATASNMLIWQLMPIYFIKSWSTSSHPTAWNKCDANMTTRINRLILLFR